MKHNATFAPRLRKLMEATNMSQVELAGRLGLTHAAVHNYLAGRVPKADILIEIANVFGVSVDDLLHKDVAALSPSPAGLFATDAGMFLADLRADLAAVDGELREAESKLKKAKDRLGVAKIIAERLESIHKLNVKRTG